MLLQWSSLKNRLLHSKQRHPKCQLYRLLPMRKEAENETEKTPHLLVGLHSSLKLKGKELILHFKRKSVRKSLEVQGEIAKEVNKHLQALSNKSKTDSMAWRCLPLHNKARGQLTSKPPLKKSRLKMNY